MAYMSRDYAERETKRGTSDPTYLVYTLGTRNPKIRHDYHEKTGRGLQPGTVPRPIS